MKGGFEMSITLTVEEACQKLRDVGMKISPETIRMGLQQQRFPFGDCIVSEKSVRFFVYKKLLDDWIAERT